MNTIVHPPHVALQIIIHHNTSNNEATCFMVDARILPLKTPGETTNKPIEDWISILHIFGKGNLFVYDPTNSYGLFMHNYERIEYDRFRLHVSDPLSMEDMQPGMNNTRNDLLNGEVGVNRSYLFTHFGDLDFVKRRKEDAERAKKKAQDEAAKNRGRRKETWEDVRDEFNRRAREETQYEWRRNPWGNDANFEDWFWRTVGGGGYQQQGRSGSAERSTTSSLDGYYKVLGITSSASDDEVKKAYRKMARTYHPDVSKLPKEEATIKQAELNAAYANIKAQRNLK